MPSIIPQDFAFYADESGTSQDRFTVVGGLSMHQSTASKVHESIAKFRDEFDMRSEMKWSKVSNQKIKEYQAFVEIFFALNASNQLQFHCLIFDSHQWNHKKYNGGDADIGLSKLYYDLLLHKFVKPCGSNGNTLFACLDHRNSSTSLHDLRRMLNSTAARDHGLAHQPLAQLVSRDSKSDCILQLNDVILGAVSAVRNGKHLLVCTREAKRKIALSVLENSGLQTFETDSHKRLNKFTVWNKKPRQR